MAETRAQRMQVVLTLAQRHEDEAARRLGDCRDSLAAEERQLADLVEYRDQYLTAQGEPRTGIYAQELINYSHFIARLVDACREQEGKVARTQAALAMLQQQWREKYQKRQSIKDLITRLQQEENLLLDKRLQKELDELSAQQLQRRTTE